MTRSSLWGATLVALAVTAVTLSVVTAAPLDQDSTPTPSQTPTPFGPTPTPTPTLLPLPVGGGRVSVGELAVRVGPDQSWSALGRLEYGETVFPVARSVNGNWVAIPWDGDMGWLLESLVEWHPDFDVLSLPVFLPPFTATPLITAPAASPTGTPAATETSGASATPVPTESPQPTSAWTPTRQPTATEAPARTETAASGTIGESESESPQPAAATTGPSPLALLDPSLLPWLGIGIPIVLVGLYGWRFAVGERERRRYREQYPLTICPACQVGHLQLEESARRTLGVTRMSRTVRCDMCHSVMRQVRPGLWRYTIDPYVNPQLATDYNGKLITDPQLVDLAGRVDDYPPEPFEARMGTDRLTDEDILADLEAKIAAEEASSPLELSGDPGELSSGATGEGEG